MGKYIKKISLLLILLSSIFSSVSCKKEETQEEKFVRELYEAHPEGIWESTVNCKINAYKIINSHIHEWKIEGKFCIRYNRIYSRICAIPIKFKGKYRVDQFRFVESYYDGINYYEYSKMVLGSGEALHYKIGSTNMSNKFENQFEFDFHANALLDFKHDNLPFYNYNRKIDENFVYFDTYLLFEGGYYNISEVATFDKNYEIKKLDKSVFNCNRKDSVTTRSTVEIVNDEIDVDVPKDYIEECTEITDLIKYFDESFQYEKILKK